MKASTHGHKDLMREDRHRVAATLCRAALSAPRARPEGAREDLRCLSKPLDFQPNIRQPYAIGELARTARQRLLVERALASREKTVGRIFPIKSVGLNGSAVGRRFPRGI
jgi:hypothetical protein